MNILRWQEPHLWEHLGQGKEERSGAIVTLDQVEEEAAGHAQALSSASARAADPTPEPRAALAGAAESAKVRRASQRERERGSCNT